MLFLFTCTRDFSNRDETARETDSMTDTKLVLRIRKSDFLPDVPSTSLSRTPRLPSTTGSGSSARRLLLLSHPASRSYTVSSRPVYTSAAPHNFIEFAAERAAFHGQLWCPTLSSPLALYSAILNLPTYNSHPSFLKRGKGLRVQCLSRSYFRLIREHTGWFFALRANGIFLFFFSLSACFYRCFDITADRFWSLLYLEFAFGKTKCLSAPLDPFLQEMLYKSFLKLEVFNVQESTLTRYFVLDLISIWLN